MAAPNGNHLRSIFRVGKTLELGQIYPWTRRIFLNRNEESVKTVLSLTRYSHVACNDYQIAKQPLTHSLVSSTLRRDPRRRRSLTAVGVSPKAALWTIPRRYIASDGPGLDAATLKSKMDNITDKFIEARDLLEDARDVKGTVYFSDDMKEAVEAVNDTIEEYTDLLEQLSENQRQDVLRTIGLKMAELKAHKSALEEE